MRKANEMPYHVGLKVKIYPSYRQKHLIAVNDGVKRAVYNHLVAYHNEKYWFSKTEAFIPAYKERIDYLKTVLSSLACLKNALPFLYEKDVDEQAIANAIRNYRTAWKNQKERHTGVPTFKRKSNTQSYQTNAHYYTNGSSNVRFLDQHHVTLPKLGKIRFDASPLMLALICEQKADTRIGTITISKDSVGEYWASFAVASEEPFYAPLPKTGSMQGIDLNLIELVNDSDGYASANKHYLNASLEQLTKAQRKLSRMAERAKKENRSLKTAKNYQKQRQKVAYLHRKVARQREDYLHQLSKHEIENQDFIAAENLQVKNLMKNHHLAKAIADASWGKLLTQLQYKATFYGKTVVLVPPQNTTQTCSHCGHVVNNPRPN